MNAIGTKYELPRDKQRSLKRAVRLEWISVAFLASIVLLMGMVMSSSQVMKTMWLEDTLSLIPSVSFLVGAHFRGRPPDESFPYGYRRAVLVGFLCGAVALFGFGVYILSDSLMKLLKAEHPSIPTVQIAGTHIWLGWIMITVMTYSVIPPLILGKLKQPFASELHDKALYVSAAIDKGDWLSGVAGVAGLVGIAFGLWWADAAAASLISFEIIKDGWQNLRNSVEQLMNKRPSNIETRESDPVVDKLQERLEELDWVKRARVRLREDGDVLTGEAFLVVGDTINGGELLNCLEQAQEVANAMDWRLHDVNMVPVRSVD